MHQIGRYHGEWKRRKRKWRFNVRGICKNLAPELGHRMRCPLCWHVIFSLIPNFIPKIISIWDEPRVFYFRFYLPFESGRREHLIISIWDEPRVFFILGGIELLKEFCWLYENAHFIRDRSDSEKHNHSESQSDEWVRRYEWQTYDTLVSLCNVFYVFRYDDFQTRTVQLNDLYKFFTRDSPNKVRIHC